MAEEINEGEEVQVEISNEEIDKESIELAELNNKHNSLNRENLKLKEKLAQLSSRVSKKEKLIKDEEINLEDINKEILELESENKNLSIP